MRVAKWVFVLAAGLLLGACADMGTKQPKKLDPDIDVAKVATINRWARANGMTVIWISYPLRSHPKASDGS